MGTWRRLGEVEFGEYPWFHGEGWLNRTHTYPGLGTYKGTCLSREISKCPHPPQLHLPLPSIPPQEPRPKCHTGTTLPSRHSFSPLSMSPRLSHPEWSTRPCSLLQSTACQSPASHPSPATSRCSIAACCMPWLGSGNSEACCY